MLPIRFSHPYAHMINLTTYDHGPNPAWGRAVVSVGLKKLGLKS